MIWHASATPIRACPKSSTTPRWRSTSARSTRRIEMDHPVRGRWLTISLLAIGILGCAPVYQVKTPDPETGLLPTHLEVPAEEILVYTPKAKVREVRFFLVRAASGGLGNNQSFVDFFRSAVKQLGIDQVVTYDELTKIGRASCRERGKSSGR